MKVILQQTVHKLGNAGDIVEAAGGYYRNFLQPRKLAVLATDGALKKREEDKEALRRKAEKAHQGYVDLADRVTALGSLQILAKSGDGGKLYGKVTNKEIASAIARELGEEIDKRLIKTSTEITALGSYTATIKLTSDVQSTIGIEVLPEGGPSATSKPSNNESAREARSKASSASEEE
jgi:large subunit ribosomal protein L9